MPGTHDPYKPYSERYLTCLYISCKNKVGPGSFSPRLTVMNIVQYQSFTQWTRLGLLFICLVGLVSLFFAGSQRWLRSSGFRAFAVARGEAWFRLQALRVVSRVYGVPERLPAEPPSAVKVGCHHQLPSADHDRRALSLETLNCQGRGSELEGLTGPNPFM